MNTPAPASGSRRGWRTLGFAGAACLACCAGPILAAVGGIGAIGALAAWFLWPAVGAAAAAMTVGALLLLRHQRQPDRANPQEPEPVELSVRPRAGSTTENRS